MKTAAIYTLGCKVNQYEADAIRELFCTAGYRMVPFSEPAQVYVVHSCAVTLAAERKTRQMIRRARRQNPDARIVVSGCYAQVGADALQKMPEVDLLVGTQGRGEMVRLVEDLANTGPMCTVGDIMQVRDFEELSLQEGSERTRAFLKIQEGCNQFCSYCMVPYARGPVRSRGLNNILAEARRLTAHGYTEIVITGVNLGLYGQDLTDGSNLQTVLRAVHAVPGLERIRISSIEPTEVTEALLDELVSMEKVCRHFHIPLQSGDDEILQRMNRRYRTDAFMQVVAAIRTRFPKAGISTDVIVGFPGESEEQFANTQKCVAQAAFSRTHVFAFSPRPGTPAATLPDPVPGPVKEERSRILHAQAAAQALAFHRTFLGETVPVLAEKYDPDTGLQEGLTEEYIRVTFPGSEALTGQLVPICLETAEAEGMRGRREKMSG
jgi:threonylcarbamoyladenosine tRNA methylthiotransferase MtaB